MAETFGDIVFDEGEKHPATLEELVEGWLAYQASLDKDIDSEYWWACQAVFDLTADYPEWAWRFILATLEVLNKVPNDNAFGLLGASTLEDLLDYHGSLVIDRIEAEAQKSQQFRRLLGTIWESGPPEVWQRILAMQSTP